MDIPQDILFEHRKRYGRFRALQKAMGDDEFWLAVFTLLGPAKVDAMVVLIDKLVDGGKRGDAGAVREYFGFQYPARSLAQMAKLRGVSRQRVNQLIKAGCDAMGKTPVDIRNEVIATVGGDGKHDDRQ